MAEERERSIMSPEVEAMVHATTKFTEQLVHMNQHLAKIREDGVAVREYFESGNGFRQDLEGILKQISESVNELSETQKSMAKTIEREQKDFIKTQLNIVVLKLAGAVGIIAGVITAISKAVGP